MLSIVNDALSGHHVIYIVTMATCLLLVGEGVLRRLQCRLYSNTATLSEERLWQTADRVQ